MIGIVLSALAFLAALAAARYGVARGLGARLERAEPALRRYGPLAAAVVCVAVVWVVWDAVVPVPKVQDENSYLLQAEIFARGRWTAPSPPIPEFFEQPHVQVVPRLASKYPPGHTLLLTLGTLAHFPPLVPLLLTAAAGALLFALASRLANPWVAAMACLIWVTAPMVLRFQPGYFSESTTLVMTLGAWWSLLEWRESRRRRWLLLLALAIGWGAITRPLTMLALAVPVGVIVLRDVVRLRLWRDLAVGVAVGLAVLSILPLWSARTTGDWRVSPIEKYRLDYLPFDKLGFTPDTSAPRRAITPVLRTEFDYFLTARKGQPLSAAPLIFVNRVIQIAIAFFQLERLPLLLFAAAGLAFARAPLRFGVVSAVVLLLAYLPYAHWAPWTIYYMEITPVIAALTALGIWGTLSRVASSGPTARLGVAAVGLVLLVIAVPTMGRWRRDHRARSSMDRAFAKAMKQLPPRSIVFLRYSPRVGQHLVEVFNYPDLSVVPVWVVHDLGPRNDELRRLAPDRVSFDFDEDQLVRGRRATRPGGDAGASTGER